MAKLYAEEKTAPKSEQREVGMWQERVGLGKKAHEDWSESSGAKRFVKEYRGEFPIVFNQRRGRVPVPAINEVFSYVQSDIATTYNRDPYISVNAKAGTTKGAALWETKLNYEWRVLKTKEELEYEIIDKDLVGFGWHKVGWSVTSSGNWETLKIDDEKLYSKWIDWKDVVWNVGSKRPPVDCAWMAQRIVMPLEDLKRKYPAAKGLEGSPPPDIDSDTYKKSQYKDDVKVGVVWEIWDARDKKIRLIAEGLKDKFLDAPKDWPSYLPEFPFLMYWDFAVPGRAQPMSAIAPWEPQLLEEMVLTAQMVNHSKRWNRQMFYNGGVFDEDALDKYERGDDGAMIRVPGKVGSDDLRFADFGQLPPDFYLTIDRLQATRRSINGQPEFSRGGVTKTGTRTVGELNLMAEGNKGRQDRKIDRLETHCENIARHMMFHLKANFDFEETLKVTGDLPPELIEALGSNFNPETGEVTFTAADIEGEYDVDIKAGSTLPLNKQNKMQILELVMNTIAVAAASGPVSPLLNAIIQESLRGYDIKGLEEAYAQEVALAEQAKQVDQQNQDIQDDKTLAEANKRKAQTSEINANTAIVAQDAAIGPLGRAQIKRLEKPEPKPVGASR